MRKRGSVLLRCLLLNLFLLSGTLCGLGMAQVPAPVEMPSVSGIVAQWEKHISSSERSDEASRTSDGEDEEGDESFSEEDLRSLYKIPDLDAVLEPLALQLSKTGSLHILHIGDSHTQAGYFPGAVRTALQKRFGNAGRGWISPLRMARTNQPTDYSFTSVENSCASCILSYKNQCTPTGPGGIQIRQINKRRPGFECSLRNGFFDRLLVARSVLSPPLVPLYTPHNLLLGKRASQITGGMVIDTINLFSPLSSVRLMAETEADTEAIYGGVALMLRLPGIVYHEVGLNGATYALYDRSDFARNVALLRPQVVLLCLGSNEIIGRGNQATLEAQIGSSIRTLRQAMPQARFILVTPPPIRPQSVRRTTRYVSSGRGRKGKRGRRKKRRVVSTSTYNNAPDNVLRAIFAVAEEEQLPVIDLYTLMEGRKGYERRRQDGGYYAADGVHFTIRGYEEQGSLIAQELVAALQVGSPSRPPVPKRLPKIVRDTLTERVCACHVPHGSILCEWAYRFSCCFACVAGFQYQRDNNSVLRSVSFGENDGITGTSTDYPFQKERTTIGREIIFPEKLKKEKGKQKTQQEKVLSLV